MTLVDLAYRTGRGQLHLLLNAVLLQMEADILHMEHATRLQAAWRRHAVQIRHRQAVTSISEMPQVPRKNVQTPSNHAVSELAAQIAATVSEAQSKPSLRV